MLLGSQNLIYRDVEALLKEAGKHKFGLSKKDIQAMLRDLREISLTYECSELEFLDTRIIDDSIKGTIADTIDFLIGKKVIKKKENIIREVDGYFVFDEKVFSGKRIHYPSQFFDEKDLLFPYGKERRKQTLVKYPKKIADHIKNGAQFTFLRAVHENSKFKPTLEEKMMFEDFIYLEDRKSKRRSYFGVWS